MSQNESEKRALYNQPFNAKRIECKQTNNSNRDPHNLNITQLIIELRYLSPYGKSRDWIFFNPVNYTRLKILTFCP
jgi:hypothetical protein